MKPTLRAFRCPAPVPCCVHGFLARATRNTRAPLRNATRNGRATIPRKSIIGVGRYATPFATDTPRRCCAVSDQKMGPRNTPSPPNRASKKV